MSQTPTGSRSVAVPGRRRSLAQRVRRASRPESGFTLIELLVVIIILGILAAVVVFAVQGTGDKGKEASIQTDEKTIRTAEEAFCAQNGRYADGIDLVAGGFLSDKPVYHDVAAVKNGGPCNGWNFSILRTEAAGAARGSMQAIAPPPGPTFDLIRLPSGLVLNMLDLSGPTTAFSVWDPATNQWRVPSAPSPVSYGASGGSFSGDRLVRGTPAECGTNCGKVLYHANGGFYPPTYVAWWYFNVDKYLAGAPAAEQWEPIPASNPAFGSESTFATLEMVQLLDNPGTPQSECGSNCGKFLIQGGNAPDDYELFDPKTNTFQQFFHDPTPIGPDYECSAPLGRGPIRAPLPDGRILVAGSPECYDYVTENFYQLNVQFDPMTAKFIDAPRFPDNMSDPNAIYYMGYSGEEHPVTLPNGDLLFSGIVAKGIAQEPYTEALIYHVDQPTSPWEEVQSCTVEAPIPPSNAWCKILGSTPDGRVLGWRSTEAPRRTDPDIGSAGNEMFLFEPSTRTWSRTSNIINPKSRTDSVILDRRGGECGTYCNTVLIAGDGSAEIFTP